MSESKLEYDIEISGSEEVIKQIKSIQKEIDELSKMDIIININTKKSHKKWYQFWK